jgi:hypothetical protein
MRIYGATQFPYKLGVGFARCEKNDEKSAPKLFLTPATIKKWKHSNQPKPTTHPIQSHSLTQREKRGKKPPSHERKLLFAYFVTVLVT